MSCRPSEIQILFICTSRVSLSHQGKHPKSRAKTGVTALVISQETREIALGRTATRTNRLVAVIRITNARARAKVRANLVAEVPPQGGNLTNMEGDPVVISAGEVAEDLLAGIHR